MPPGRAFSLLYRTFLRSVFTRGRLVWLVAVVALSFVNSAIFGANAEGTGLDQGIEAADVLLAMLIGVGVLVIGSAVLGDLYDNGSIVYVALRPVASGVVAAAAWSATVTLTLPVAVVSATSVVLAHSGSGLPAATIVGSFLSVAAFAGIFVFLGVLVRRAVPVGLAYLLLWEGFISLAGTSGAALTVSGYLRSLVARLTDHPVEVAPFTMPVAVIAPLVIAAATVAATAWLLDRRELP